MAALAGVSVEYYSRIERSGLAGVSPSILHAIARALELDAAGRAHLQLPAQASWAATSARPAVEQTSRADS